MHRFNWYLKVKQADTTAYSKSRAITQLSKKWNFNFKWVEIIEIKNN